MASARAHDNDQYERLLDHLVERMADIAAATARAIRMSIPAYAKVWDEVGHAVERVVLETNLHLVHTWRTGLRPEPDEFSRLGRIGVPPVELGIGIDDVLHAYRISAETLITGLSDASRSYAGIDPQRLMNAALTEVSYLNDLSLSVWRESIERERADLRRREDVEGSLVAALVASPPRIDEATRLGKLLGLPALAGPWCVIVAAPAADRHPTDVLVDLRGAVAATGQQCLSGIVEQRIVVVTRPLARPEVLAPIPHAVYGIGSDHPGPGGVLEGYSEAREALEVAVSNGIPYAHIDRVWLDRLLLGSLSPLDLAERVLAPIAHLPGARRSELEHTLDAYLIFDRRITETARHLHLHPHTVRYRLDQLAKLLGGVLDSHDQRLALQLALRARRLLRRSGNGPGPDAHSSDQADLERHVDGYHRGGRPGGDACALNDESSTIRSR